MNHHRVTPYLPALSEHRVRGVNIELLKQTLLYSLLVEVVILLKVLDSALKFEIPLALLDFIVLNIADDLISDTLLSMLISKLLFH